MAAFSPSPRKANPHLRVSICKSIVDGEQYLWYAGPNRKSTRSKCPMSSISIHGRNKGLLQIYG